ncbi:MAG TPA: hypothetical protein PKD45_05370 [Flavobacteriales bacterium]|nr:hypothetical protein [Flavobacteriales bacterium]
MMMKHRGLWLTLALSVALLAFYFGAVLRSPGQYMFNTAGDGLKNYFSFAWHAEHDTSFTTFSGMNYPFGEHIDYPDAQPLQSNLWRAVAKVWPGALQHTVAVVNLMMLFSIVLCAVFLYLIMRELAMPDLVAALFAVLISFLAPQVLRGTQAHYALAYGCAIPSAMWVLLRQWRSSRPWRWAAGMVLLILFWLFTHVYLGFISAVLVLATGALVLVFRAGERRAAWGMVAAPLAAFLLFFLWQQLTDTHTGRTQHPTGFFTYQMTWSTLLAPDPLFASSIWTRFIGLPVFRLAEGWNFIGLGTELVVVVVLILLMRGLAKGTAGELFNRVFPAKLLLLLGGSLLLLAFAFGLPFDPWCKKCLWYIPTLGQFRAPARFGWAFYFVITVWAARTAWVLYDGAAQGRARKAAAVLVAVVAAFFVTDMHALDSYVARRIVEQPNYFDPEQLPADMQPIYQAAKRVDARAMVTLPYYHNGGEEYMVPADEAGLLIGQAMAQLTGIPLMNSSFTRTGVEEVRELIQAFGPDWYPKAMAARFQASDTILLILSGSLLGPYDQVLASHGRELAKGGPYTLLATTAGELFADRAGRYVARFEASRDTLHQSGEWLFSRPDTFLFRKDYDDRPATHVRSGSGAFSGLKHDFNLLAELPVEAMDTGVTYLASFWYYNRGPMRNHALAGIDDHDPVQGTGAWDYYTDPRFARTIVGDWSLVELPFRKGGPGHELKLFVQGADFYPDSIWVDDLTVRVADVDVYKVDTVGNRLWYNNHWIAP